MRFQVQGYCIPWNRVGFAEGREETAAPTSIAPPRPEGCNVTMIFGDHVTTNRAVYAQTKDRTLSFFADDYGLGFSAWLDDQFAAHRSIIAPLREGLVSQCSVNLVDYRFVEDVDGRQRLIYGRIDHFTLANGAAYPDTGCWLADQPINDRAPWLRDMSLQYGRTVLAMGLAGRSPAMTAGVPARGKAARGDVGAHAGIASRQPVAVPQSVLALLASPVLDRVATMNRKRLAMLDRRGGGWAIFGGAGSVPASVLELLEAHERDELFPVRAERQPPAGAIDAYEGAMSARQ